MMKTATIKPTTDNLPHEIGHKGKWRNMGFLKDGRSYWAVLLHDSEAAAARSIQQWESYPNAEFITPPNFPGFHISQYSHSIPMPVKE